MNCHPVRLMKNDRLTYNDNYLGTNGKCSEMKRYHPVYFEVRIRTSVGIT